MSPCLRSRFSHLLTDGLDSPILQVVDNFDAMDLKPELLRGIYAVSYNKLCTSHSLC